MSKRFRLKKDFLGHGNTVFFAGHGLVLSENTEYYKFEGSDYLIELSYVEQNSDWFEEVTDTERIEVTGLVRFDRAGSFVSSPSNRWQYIFYTNNDLPIPESQLPAIKEAIEKVINNDSVFNAEKINQRINQLAEMEEAFNAARLTHPLAGMKYDTFVDYCREKNDSENFPVPKSKEEKKEQSRDWEIVAYRIGQNIWVRQNVQKEYFNVNGRGYFERVRQKELPIDAEIHSVRRLSDNTVWTVGEHHAGFSYKDRVIESFRINERGEIVVYQSGGHTRIEDLKKLPPKTLPPLFVTEDGKPTYEDDEYWTVEKHYEIGHGIGGDTYNQSPHVLKTFSTKEAADEYVLMNKPSLSAKDIMYILDNTSNQKDVREYTIKLAKQKQQKH